MQTISWDDEIKLIDGIPYYIDFYQDFSAMRLNGHLVADLPVASIIEFISNLKAETEIYDVCNHTHSAKSYQRSQEFREALDNFNKKEKKLAKEWKRGKKNRTLDRKKLLDEIASGEYFLKNRR